MVDGKLTELETAKMELFALRHRVFQEQLSGNLKERAAYISKIEEAHPGYRWDEGTGLVPIEQPSEFR